MKTYLKIEVSMRVNLNHLPKPLADEILFFCDECQKGSPPYYFLCDLHREVVEKLPKEHKYVYQPSYMADSQMITYDVHVRDEKGFKIINISGDDPRIISHTPNVNVGQGDLVLTESLS